MGCLPFDLLGEVYDIIGRISLVEGERKEGLTISTTTSTGLGGAAGVGGTGTEAKTNKTKALSVIGRGNGMGNSRAAGIGSSCSVGGSSFSSSSPSSSSSSPSSASSSTIFSDGSGPSTSLSDLNDRAFDLLASSAAVALLASWSLRPHSSQAISILRSAVFASSKALRCSGVAFPG